MTLSVRVTCNNKGHWRKLPFGGIHIDKATGVFSGRTSRRHKAWKGTVSGQAADGRITATWNYLDPDGSCWGNGTWTRPAASSSQMPKIIPIGAMTRPRRWSKNRRGFPTRLAL